MSASNKGERGCIDKILEQNDERSLHLDELTRAASLWLQIRSSQWDTANS
jgi:hypothetical protein